MSTPVHLQIPRALYDQMIEHAFAELPNECCGLLAGPPVSDATVAQVTHLYRLVNAAASPVEYLSQPESLFAAVRDMRTHDIDIVAVYHSHPTSAPLPSRTDRERNYSTDIVNFIISLMNGKAVVRGWWLTPEDYREAGWEITDQQAGQ